MADRKSLLIALLATSDQYATFFLQNGGRRPFWKASLDDRKSLSIAFLAISDQYTTFLFFFDFFTKWPPAAILEVRFPPKYNRVLPLCVINGYAKYEVDR